MKQQNVVYYCKCGLRDGDHVNFMSRHLYTHVEGQQSATTQRMSMERIHYKQFQILKKSLRANSTVWFLKAFFRELKPKLNQQSDSIRGKL